MQNDAQFTVRYVMIADEEDGQRLDNYLLRVLKGVPKSHIYRIVRSGEVRINRKRAKPSSRVAAGDSIRIPPIRHSSPKTTTVSETLSDCLRHHIIFEDERLLVLAKPAGIAVHGGSGVSLGVIEAMRQIRPDLHYLELVHRLDRDTSGCLLLAKKRSCLRAIQALLEARQVQKTYWALLEHPWQEKSSLVVDMPLLKSVLKSGERMVVASATEGKPSQTSFTVLGNYTEACWVEVLPKTGRTHQIRVHAAELGHPIIGDRKYGQMEMIPSLSGLKSRMYLHARAIQFTLNGKTYCFEADLDALFSQALECIKKA
ncbi:MAG: RluA family pseudouridine synthase [Gammaproteobacteria bacterium]|nr:RluA family pseudouridine synthase [Gammaproteobacteria bacterium]